jgi:hypothetical protein
MVAAVSVNPITATGMKGFLLWFAREQPALYNKICKKIPQVAPQAFSNYTARRKRLGAIYRGRFIKPAAGLSGLAGYYSSYGSYNSYASAPVTVNYTAQLSNPSYTASPTVDYTAQLPTYTASTDPGALQTVNTGASGGGVSVVPIAGAANSGSFSTPTGTAVGALISGVAAGAMTLAQQQALNGAVNTQLQRAGSGLAPLNTSLNSLGVPTVGSGSLSMETLLVLGGAAALALVLLGDSK